jgi:hypothetical protein
MQSFTNQRQRNRQHIQKTFWLPAGGGFWAWPSSGNCWPRAIGWTAFRGASYPELRRPGRRTSCLVTSPMPAAVKDAVRGRDAVFHVAAKAGVWGTFEDYHRPNVIGTRNVITACRSSRVPMMVYTSSPSVVFDGGDMQGVDESVPYPPTIMRPTRRPKPWPNRR